MFAKHIMLRKNNPQNSKIKKRKQHTKIQNVHIAVLILLCVLFFYTAILFNKSRSFANSSPKIWGFSTPIEYSYNTSTTDISGGTVSLKSVDQIDDDNDSVAGFGAGIFSDTEFDTDHIKLNSTGLTNGNGTFTSRIIDAAGEVSWSGFFWEPKRPYGKPLLNNEADESGYDLGNFTNSNNLFLLHLDESSGATTFSDSSGNSNNFTCVGATCPSQTGNGKFDGAYSFISGDNLLDSDGEDYLNGLTSFTMSAWVKSNVTGVDNGIFLGRVPNGSDDVIGIRYDASGASGGCTSCIKAGITTAGGNHQIESSSNVQTTEWQHVVLTWSSNNPLKLYLNGDEDAASHLNASVAGSITGATQALIGKGAKDNSGSKSWNGLIDEFVLFDKVLTNSEIKDLYYRGANKLKLQVRSCNDALCLGESFVGPDGTTATYFEDTSKTNTAPPSTESLSGIVSDNQYFQYQVTFETDTTTVSAQLNQVEITPVHYFKGQTIQNNLGQIYSTLDGFSQTLGAGNEGLVKYQLSPNGSDFYYYNGVDWVSTTLSSQVNSASVIDANIDSFVDDVETGSLVFKAFLQSASGTQAVELDEVRLAFDQSLPSICGNSVVESGEECDDGNVKNGDGCSTTCKQETNSGGGGGGVGGFVLPPEAFIPPVAPDGGFKVLINNGTDKITNPDVNLSFVVGEDVQTVAISYDDDFTHTSIRDNTNNISWNLCGDPDLNGVCDRGAYTVYVKFFNTWGQASEVVSASVLFDKNGNFSGLSLPNINIQKPDIVPDLIEIPNTVNPIDVIEIEENLIEPIFEPPVQENIQEESNNEIIIENNNDIFIPDFDEQLENKIEEKEKLNLQKNPSLLFEKIKRQERELLAEGRTDYLELVSNIKLAFSEYKIENINSKQIVHSNNNLRTSQTIKALSNLLNKLDNQKIPEPIFESFYSFGSVDLTFLAVNPTDKEQKITFSKYLPEEVTKNDILDHNEFDLVYDFNKKRFNVKKELVLLPYSFFEDSVSLRDIWVIPEEELKILTENVVQVASLLTGTPLGAQAEKIKQSAISQLRLIRLRQEKGYDRGPEDHILTYRINRKQLEKTTEMIVQLHNIVLEERKLQRNLLEENISYRRLFGWSLLILGIAISGILFGLVYANKRINV